MKNRKSFFRVILILSTLVIIAVVGTVFIFESIATKNSFINISKRSAAEVGAVASKLFFRDDNANKFSFGPKIAQNNIIKNVPLKECLKSIYNNGLLEYSEENNFNLPSYAWTFQYEDLRSNKLMELKTKYNLDFVVRDESGELNKILKLADWVKNQINRGSPKNVDYNFNALDILSRAKKGEKFFCSEYATVFLQCALSLGYQARYVGLLKGHVVNEVWSNEHAKWFIIDIDNGAYYLRNGIPLSVLQLHDAFEMKEYDSIQVFSAANRMVNPAFELINMLSYYHEFYVRMRNDWFSNRYPHWHYRSNSIMNSLEWKDQYTKDNSLVSKSTENKNELYFPINVVSLRADPEVLIDSNIRLILDTFTPNFSYFSLLIDDKKTDIIKDSVYIYKAHLGENTIKVSSVNALGIKGPLLSIRFLLD